MFDPRTGPAKRTLGALCDTFNELPGSRSYTDVQCMTPNG
jgi:hypothetical protein